MKITFISQKGPSFIERNSPHIPVDLAQQCALKAHNFHYVQLDKGLIEETFDVAILLIPKTRVGNSLVSYSNSALITSSIEELNVPL